MAGTPFHIQGDDIRPLTVIFINLTYDVSLIWLVGIQNKMLPCLFPGLEQLPSQRA